MMKDPSPWMFWSGMACIAGAIVLLVIGALVIGG